MIPAESLMRSLETGLPSQYDPRPGPRIYQRTVNTCGQCHCFCPGTMFVPSTCAQLRRPVEAAAVPPADCPLPLA